MGKLRDAEAGLGKGVLVAQAARMTRDETRRIPVSAPLQAEETGCAREGMVGGPGLEPEASCS